MTQEERDEKNKKTQEKVSSDKGKHGCHQTKKGKGKGTIGGNDSGRKK